MSWPNHKFKWRQFPSDHLYLSVVMISPYLNMFVVCIWFDFRLQSAVCAVRERLRGGVHPWRRAGGDTMPRVGGESQRDTPHCKEELFLFSSCHFMKSEVLYKLEQIVSGWKIKNLEAGNKLFFKFLQFKRVRLKKQWSKIKQFWSQEPTFPKMLPTASFHLTLDSQNNPDRIPSVVLPTLENSCRHYTTVDCPFK